VFFLVLRYVFSVRLGYMMFINSETFYELLRYLLCSHAQWLFVFFVFVLVVSGSRLC